MSIGAKYENEFRTFEMYAVCTHRKTEKPIHITCSKYEAEQYKDSVERLQKASKCFKDHLHVETVFVVMCESNYWNNLRRKKEND